MPLHTIQNALTTIKASTTALLSDRPPKAEQQRDYIVLMDEEADRLSGWFQKRFRWLG